MNWLVTCVGALTEAWRWSFSGLRGCNGFHHGDVRGCRAGMVIFIGVLIKCVANLTCVNDILRW